jgi:sulfite exporter TauE/SafE
MGFSILAGFALGIAGSMHCVGMCGPLALLLPTSQRFPGAYISNFLYQFGRVITYVLLGAFFGGIMEWLDIRKFEQWISLTIGIVFLLIWANEFFNKSSNLLGFISNWVNKKFASTLNEGGAFKWLIAGMLNGLLPCGLVYGALLGSLGMGSWLNGILFMFGFGLATMPALLAVTFTKHLINSRVKLNLQKLMPFWLLIMGILFVLRGANLGIPFLSPKFSHSADISSNSSCCSGGTSKTPQDSQTITSKQKNEPSSCCGVDANKVSNKNLNLEPNSNSCCSESKSTPRKPPSVNTKKKMESNSCCRGE